jgi:hypothetical protein
MNDDANCQHWVTNPWRMTRSTQQHTGQATLVCHFTKCRRHPSARQSLPRHAQSQLKKGLHYTANSHSSCIARATRKRTLAACTLSGVPWACPYLSTKSFVQSEHTTCYECRAEDHIKYRLVYPVFYRLVDIDVGHCLHASGTSTQCEGRQCLEKDASIWGRTPV